MYNNSTLSSPNFSFLSYGIYFTGSIVIAVLSSIAVASNALIVAAIWKKTFQRTSFHILLSGLAVTDLCTGLVAQPLAATNILLYITHPKQYRDRSMPFIAVQASAEGFVTYFILLSLFTITLMSVERWLHMSRRSMVTARRGYLTCASLLLLPLPFALIKVTHPGWVRVAILVVKLVCLLTTSVAYFNVFRIIRRHKQTIQGNAPSQMFGQPAINLAKYKKSVFTILYILGLFYFSFLPIIIANWVHHYLHVNSTIWEESIYVCLVLLFLSSSLNPGLYLWRMKDVRDGVKQLLCSRT